MSEPWPEAILISTAQRPSADQIYVSLGWKYYETYSKDEKGHLRLKILNGT